MSESRWYEGPINAEVLNAMSMDELRRISHFRISLAKRYIWEVTDPEKRNWISEEYAEMKARFQEDENEYDDYDDYDE